MSKMYENFKIGNTDVKNRLVASAMFEYGADDGEITPKIEERYRELSQGGAGLIITGMQAIRKSGSTAPLMVNVKCDSYVQNMKKIIAAVHNNESKLFVQLQHCGIKSFHADGYDCISVCDEITEDGRKYHGASEEELKEIATDFATAAVKCKEAGADGVQIHAAHGYLINTFLSPSTNHRKDKYGGNIQNRARLLFEIYDSIREAVGDDYPISVKFPFNDLNEDSISEEESLFVCKRLEEKGINMIEVSSGMLMDGSEYSFNPIFRCGENVPFKNSASFLSEKVSIPVISVCGYRYPESIEETLRDTAITAVSFGRPLVCEPNLPNRWKTDMSESKCKSCNACCKSFIDGIITCQIKKNM